MNRSLGRLALVLAASELAPLELREALQEVEHQGADHTVNMVRDLRRAMLRHLSMIDLPEEEIRDKGGARAPSSVQVRNHRREGLAERIRSGLQDAVGLRSDDAARLLVQSILDERPSLKARLPMMRSKEGLRPWPARLLRVVPASVVLHHAAKVRKQHGGGEAVDWPLKDKE